MIDAFAVLRWTLRWTIFGHFVQLVGDGSRSVNKSRRFCMLLNPSKLFGFFMQLCFSFLSLTSYILRTF